jgi:hypothetical protein
MKSVFYIEYHLKHFLKIWALSMLFVHLAFLALVSFTPGEGLSVSFRKECLKDKHKATVAASDSHTISLFSLFSETSEETRSEYKVCTVKLFCTAALDAYSLFTPALYPEDNPFTTSTYPTRMASRDPDPPRFV